MQIELINMYPGNCIQVAVCRVEKGDMDLCCFYRGVFAVTDVHLKCDGRTRLPNWHSI